MPHPRAQFVLFDGDPDEVDTIPVLLSRFARRVMTGIAGTWRLRMKTPIGTIDADYRFTETRGRVAVTGERTGA
jgi:hypothetical protein